MEYLLTPGNTSGTRGTLILAHGAGAPMDSPFMDGLAGLLADRGVAVVRFEFPYMAERRISGKRRPPDRQPVLLDTWREVVRDVRSREFHGPLLIGGKSMGGRMATLVAEELARGPTGIAGVCCLGYPFHPPGKPERLRTEHLERLSVPVLIVQGTRDALGNREEVDSYRLSSAIRLLWLEDGDHDLKPRRKSGFSHEGHLCRAADGIGEFISIQS